MTLKRKPQCDVSPWLKSRNHVWIFLELILTYYFLHVYLSHFSGWTEKDKGYCWCYWMICRLPFCAGFTFSHRLQHQSKFLACCTNFYQLWLSFVIIHLSLNPLLEMLFLLHVGPFLVLKGVLAFFFHFLSFAASWACPCQGCWVQTLVILSLCSSLEDEMGMMVARTRKNAVSQMWYSTSCVWMEPSRLAFTNLRVNCSVTDGSPKCEKWGVATCLKYLFHKEVDISVCFRSVDSHLIGFLQQKVLTINCFWV